MSKFQFIQAYTWLYGETKSKAEQTYKFYSESERKEIINIFENNARKSFYED